MSFKIVGFFDTVKVARLANLMLHKEELNKFTLQLTQVLNYVEKLNEVNTKGIEPTSQVTGLENVTREDEVSLCLSQEEALSNSKSKHNGFFKVKAILDS